MKLGQLIRIGMLFIGSLYFYSCSSHEDNYEAVPESPVVCDLTQVPYPKLSDYHFFEGEMKNLLPVYGVLPYKPASELFTDYALKKRFVWLPKNTKATYVSDSDILELPVGSVVVKVFYYDTVLPNLTTQIIETRLMIRKSDGWIFAEYIWNPDQTDAFLETASTTRSLSIQQGNEVLNFNYRTPNTTTECNRCHGNLVTLKKNPIGIKPQNLNWNYSYGAETTNQLNKWISYGYMENNLPNTISSLINYNDTSQNLDLRIRSYFDANCAHCHKDGGEAQVHPLRMEFKDTTDPENMGVGVAALHQLPGYNGRIVQPNNIGQSILHYRVNTTTDMFYIMPSQGRSVKHKEGVQLVEQWINSF